nr:DprA-like DNA recombination-mediator protein [Enterococcus phage Planchet]
MNIAVFMGSKFGNDPKYKCVAEKVGKHIGEKGHTLVYGGSVSGLMGSVAKSTKKYGGKVLGIYPKDHFEDELPLYDVDEFIEVENMDERKRLLIDKADTYIILPGGTGTLEEFAQLVCEMVIGLTAWKTIYIMNTDGYYDGLITQLVRFIDDGFSDFDHLSDNIFVAEDIEEIFNDLKE